MMNRRQWLESFSFCCFFVLSSSTQTMAACLKAPAVVNSGSLLPSVRFGTEVEGYRTTSIYFDSILGKRWAALSNCEHPEWPQIAVPIDRLDKLPQVRPKSSTDEPTTIQVVHLGDMVRLWKQEDNLRIEVAGVAQQGGALGSVIRVRLAPRSVSDQLSQETVMGIVRGRSDVEIK
jgi:hypothetical protein